ncbi:MAG: hypothetical protein HY268_21215 [Deltaproteobacteria bacterium]|nr:hypothetical protein [Deltaproteobacteria bacterium]
MLRQSGHPSSRLPCWFSGGGSPTETPGSDLRKCIEREFLDRGAPLVQVRTMILSKDHSAAYVEFMARSLYQNDGRLKPTPGGQFFLEQTFADAAKMLWALWTHAPTLDSITLKVFRRPLLTTETKEEAILLLRATDKVLKDEALNWGKTSPLALLQQGELQCELDPRLGLRAMKEE